MDRSIHPACEICGGACCKSFLIWKGVFKTDVSAWLALHGKEEGNGVRFDLQCSALKDGLCSIYDHRPEMCKTAKVGNRMCLDAIDRFASERKDAIKTAIEVGNGNQ